MYGSKFRVSTGVMEAARMVMSKMKMFEKNGVKCPVPEEIKTESQQDFVVKAAAAKKAGETEFEFAGKTFPVTLKIDPDKVLEALGEAEDEDKPEKKEKKEKGTGSADKVEINPEVEVTEGIQDKKAVAAMKAMLDGMSKKDAIAKFGVSPKKLDALYKNLTKEELEEKKNPGIADIERRANDFGLSKKDIESYKKIADLLAKEKK